MRGKRLSITIPERTAARLEREARELGHSLSSYIRWLLTDKERRES